jgi:hypothetical protein
MNYIDYLEYFRRREYSKFITYSLLLCANDRYPTCLQILTLLKQREFRDAIMRADIAKSLGDEIFEHFTRGALKADNNETNGDTTMADTTQTTVTAI